MDNKTSSNASAGLTSNHSIEPSGSQEPSRLTIKKVWDVREGKELDAEDLLKQPEGDLIALRRRLQTAISTNSPIFVCPYCHQMIKLSGRKIQRGVVSFFSHLYDSDACFIKTTTGMSKEQIEASKYGLVSESNRHKRLKAFIAESLRSKASREKGIDQVLIEKRINSPLPYLRWRCPDVQARFNQLNLVFELQLSTTFISTIVDRDIFYRLNNYFIIWVFNFDDNQEYVNLSNLMCKDIYYANKKNVFILDEEAQQESLKRGELILKCNWLDPDNTWHFSVEKNNSDGVLVSLDQLLYDQDSSKPYYYDADADYFKIHPEALEMRRRWEMKREEIIQALIEKEKKELDPFEGQEERLRNQARQQLAISGETPTKYDNKGRYGLKYKDVILVPPMYSTISDFNEYGYAIVSSNGHVGLVDKIGNLIIPCDVNECKLFSSSDPIIDIVLKDKLILIGFKDPRKFSHGYGYSYYHKTYYGIYDYCLNEIVTPQRGQTIKDGLKEQIVVNTEHQPHSGVLSKEGDVIIPLQYGLIELWNDSLYKVRKDFYTEHSIRSAGRMTQYSSLSKSFWGLVSSNGEIVLPFEYREIENLDNNGCFIVNKSGKKGVMNLLFNTAIACEYDDIQQDNNCYIVKRAGKYGAVVSQSYIKIPCQYEEIHPWGNSLFIVAIIDGFREETHYTLRRVKKIMVMNKYYYLIKADNTRIDNHNYLTISSLKDNRANACTIDNVEVILDADGQVIG